MNRKTAVKQEGNRRQIKAIKRRQDDLPALGLDMGVFAVKAVLVAGGSVKKVIEPVSGKPREAALRCLEILLDGRPDEENVLFGITGHNAALLAGEIGVKPLLEIEVLSEGLRRMDVKAGAVISLGHENIYYLELDDRGRVSYFNRNGQCAAGSGSFWYQQATRMGFNDRELAEIALEAEKAVRISGRCAVFAKSDMTHAINEGAALGAVAAGMARALVDTVLTGVALNRINGPGRLAAAGGVAENSAVLKQLREYAGRNAIELVVPEGHRHVSALGAASRGTVVSIDTLRRLNRNETGAYRPDKPLPPLDPSAVTYLEDATGAGDASPAMQYDLSTVYLGVDCGSVSTKCVLLDREGAMIGGHYLPTSGRPALQVLELIKKVMEKYGHLVADAPVVACTTGSGRFLTQKILGAEYAVDEITCQAEGIKSLFPGANTLSIIEIGGEDSKFLQLKEGMLFDYNMNPVCAAGTGTFLENLAELLGVSIMDQFSREAFSAGYAVDLGDICTLISQSILISAASRGLPLNAQLASLAYSSARNYLGKTVEKRPLEGRLVFTGATARNHALAAALAAECGRAIVVPPRPELSGALGAALTAKMFHEQDRTKEPTFAGLRRLQSFTIETRPCRSRCEHEHNCTLNVISFTDGKKFIYGDRCGRHSSRERKLEQNPWPDYTLRREELFFKAAGEPNPAGPRVGMARCGLFYEFYPFWSAFFRQLGAAVVLSEPTGESTLEKGKQALDAEMCYPMEIIIGHYRELAGLDLDYIFLPEVVDMPALPWAAGWPRSFTCPLLQTLKGTVVNSLSLDPGRVLYAQLNYHAGSQMIAEQLRPAAQRLLGEKFNEECYRAALDEAWRAQEAFQHAMEKESVAVLEELASCGDRVAAVFLSRPYTLYDRFVSKDSLRHARERGLAAVPHDFLLAHLQGWYCGRIDSPFLEPFREDFIAYMSDVLEKIDHIYPAQLQKMLSTAIMAGFLNRKTTSGRLPRLHLVLQDPFKCGPNAMMRHYLDGLGGYLRLTLDEHTAPAGLITRLEAFKNSCRSRGRERFPALLSAQTRSVADRWWSRILIPDMTAHAGVFASVFRRYGVGAAVLPRSGDPNLTLARRFVNGEECLPFIQNLQDYLEYLNHNGAAAGAGRTVFFQGWASGPCRYGLYASTQALVINRAGYGSRKICAVNLGEALRRFGPGFALTAYNGITAMDLLYKMLHASRPYEKIAGRAEALFSHYSRQLLDMLEQFRFNWAGLLSGSYLRPLERLLAGAASSFAELPLRDEMRPRILLGGEFYVRLDDRCNDRIIERIENAGGEVCLAPVSELFNYTAHIDYLEACQAFRIRRTLAGYLKRTLYAAMKKLSHRDEARLESAAAGALHGLEEPLPEAIMERAGRYISPHYGGEPPMTIGRAAALAGRSRMAGAVFVAPFTCMPGSYVEAQQKLLQEELGIPVITVYYDGKKNTNRDEQVESLVYQAGQILRLR